MEFALETFEERTNMCGALDDLDPYPNDPASETGTRGTGTQGKNEGTAALAPGGISEAGSTTGRASPRTETMSETRRIVTWSAGIIKLGCHFPDPLLKVTNF